VGFWILEEITMTQNIVRSVLTVSDVNRYMKQLISVDSILSSLWIKGEISNYKCHSSGHMYFTLKDEGAVIKSVMFKGFNSYLKFRPENGMKIIAKGYVSIYEKDGQYQLYIEHMQPDGVGSLHIAYEQLKEELSKIGYFEQGLKKKIPFLPKRICVITSPTGSVIRDMINVLERRYPNFDLLIYPVAVQGQGACLQISKAIDRINKEGISDVIVLARGGGSIEELWAFNERVVADSIYNSHIPVVSAIGHETDFTIADFVADLRAPTPSAAAELIMPEKSLLKANIVDFNGRLFAATSNFTKLKRNQVLQLMGRPAFKQPYNFIYSYRIRLDYLSKLLENYIIKIISERVANFRAITGKLDALSPLAVLARGYSVVRKIDNGQIIKTIHDVNKDDTIELEFIDGRLECVVKNVKKGRIDK
jgi:exodeoxyribonuclease VII large subunit